MKALLKVIFITVILCLFFSFGCFEPNPDQPRSSVYINKSAIPPGELCPNGGVMIEMGIDENGNGILDVPDEVDSTEYVCDGTDGTDGTNGADGIDGVSITWLGSFSLPPESPGLNNAYYNLADGISYIWDGDSWEILCMNGQDGENAQSLNVSGTIAPGSYLTLQHNLDRNDLTFTGQFLKNGFIYDYSDYRYIFSKKYVLSQAPLTFDSSAGGYISAATSASGNVLIAYCASGNMAGKYVIYNSSGDVVAGPVTFRTGEIYEMNAAALTNGSYVIAFRYYNSGYKAYFMIVDNAGTIVQPTTVFFSGSGTNQVTNIAAAALNNGNFVLACNESVFGAADPGRFFIYDSSGALVKSATLFDGNDPYSTSILGLNSGDFVIAYSSGGIGKFLIYDSSGTTAKYTRNFSAGTAFYTDTALLRNGNFVIAFRDGGADDYGIFCIYNDAANEIKGPTVFQNSMPYEISAAAMGNDDFVLAYTKEIDYSSYGLFSVFDPYGLSLETANQYTDSPAQYFSAAPMGNDRFLIVSGDGSLQIFEETGTQQYLALEKVSSNEVRLWNLTGESLELMLSVNQ